MNFGEQVQYWTLPHASLYFDAQPWGQNQAIIKMFFLAKLKKFQCRFNMIRCPRPRRRLTRYGWCHYYNFQKSEHMVSVSLNLFHQNRRKNTFFKIAGPQSSLIFYAGLYMFIDYQRYSKTPYNSPLITPKASDNTLQSCFK